MIRYIIEKVVERVPTTVAEFTDKNEAENLGNELAGKGGVLVLAELDDDKPGQRRVLKVW